MLRWNYFRRFVSEPYGTVRMLTDTIRLRTARTYH